MFTLLNLFIGLFLLTLAILLNQYYRKSFFNKEVSQMIKQLDEFNDNVKKVNPFADDFKDIEKKPMEKLKARIDQFIFERQNEVDHISKLERYRKEYIGNVAHELKTPIFNIQGYIDTLADGGLYDEKVNMYYINKAEKNVNRMITIIDDLDAITQLEGGHLILDIEQFDILQLTKEVLESLEFTAKKSEIEIKLNRDYINPFLVFGDRHRIRQVLANLIGNSIKYGKLGGKTEISFIKIKDQVEVYVRDNGIGIAEEHLPRLFERFYRIDKGRSREQGGTGLGLAIVKHIIEAHDSQITVMSNVGVGTTFKFVLASNF
jgi:two-component system, OmpR family, phosphate regulon sensor histidine kinase PhoR